MAVGKRARVCSISISRPFMTLSPGADVLLPTHRTFITTLASHWQPSRQFWRLKQLRRIIRQTTLWPPYHLNAVYDRLQPRFNSLTALNTEPKNRKITLSGG